MVRADRGATAVTGPIERVGVVGGGLMGSGIAEVAARAGLDVVVREVDAAAADAARERIEASTTRAVDRGRLQADERDAALSSVRVVTDLDALADRQLVIEAIVEQEQAKTELFAELDRLVTAPDAILASNTSSIPIMRIAAATGRPEQVVGMHFFNPVPVMGLVELIGCLATDDDTLDRAERFASSALGKQVVRCSDRAGFVVNALLVPYLLSAVRMLDEGVATAGDIDTAMVGGCGHPMGPLTLTDLVGLDTTLHVAEVLHAEFGERHYAPPPLLRRMVEAGRLGRKSGRGFFEYG